jgi:aminopeptidase
LIQPVYKKLANIVVEYSLEVKKGNYVVVIGPTLAKELFHAIELEVLKADAHIDILPQLEGIQELFFQNASDEQLSKVKGIEKILSKECDRLVEIRADYNTLKLSNVDPQKLSKYSSSPERKKTQEIFENRSSKGELKWLVVPFPCQAYAQEAKMDIFSYSDFVFKSLFLDKDNPIEEWRKMHKDQELIVKYLNQVEKIQVLGEDTDLTLSVKGRKWRNCSGQRNLPDGEVYTGPIEDSVNGHIRFTYPGIYFGREIEDIFLEFKDGKVINATAQKSEDLLKEILKIENADVIGEFAIGTNYGVSKFTKNILFDEKMGGTMHCALGLGFEETGSKNKSTIHWDILKDMKVSGSKIIADNKVIYEEGKWNIKS